MGGHIDLRVAEVARRQYGVVAWGRLRALGLGEDAIAHRLAAGRLHAVHRGVYAVMPPALLRAEGRWMAAVLGCGSGAALSHRSAVALWGLRPWRSGTVHVSVPTQAGRDQPEIAVHRCAALHPEEVTAREGIPVTTIARTLLDVARTEPRWVLSRCVEGAVQQQVFDLREVDDLLRRHRGRPGTRRLRLAVEMQQDEPVLTRSGLERRFLALVEEAGLPRPAANATVLGYEVDALWPDARLVVEVDTRATHGSAEAFERDRERDADLAVAGYRVVRFTGRQIEGDPYAVTAKLRALLAPPGGARRPAGRAVS